MISQLITELGHCLFNGILVVLLSTLWTTTVLIMIIENKLSRLPKILLILLLLISIGSAIRGLIIM